MRAPQSGHSPHSTRIAAICTAQEVIASYVGSGAYSEPQLNFPTDLRFLPEFHDGVWAPFLKTPPLPQFPFSLVRKREGCYLAQSSMSAARSTNHRRSTLACVLAY